YPCPTIDTIGDRVSVPVSDCTMCLKEAHDERVMICQADLVPAGTLCVALPLILHAASAQAASAKAEKEHYDAGQAILVEWDGFPERGIALIDANEEPHTGRLRPV